MPFSSSAHPACVYVFVRDQENKREGECVSLYACTCVSVCCGEPRAVPFESSAQPVCVCVCVCVCVYVCVCVRVSCYVC